MDAPLENRVEDYTTPSVLSTISRVSLGVYANVPWDPSIHSKKDKWYDEQEGTYKARRQMDWYLTKVCPFFFLFHSLPQFMQNDPELEVDLP